MNAHQRRTARRASARGPFLYGDQRRAMIDAMVVNAGPVKVWFGRGSRLQPVQVQMVRLPDIRKSVKKTEACDEQRKPTWRVL